MNKKKINQKTQNFVNHYIFVFYDIKEIKLFAERI